MKWPPQNDSVCVRARVMCVVRLDSVTPAAHILNTNTSVSN